MWAIFSNVAAWTVSPTLSITRWPAVATVSHRSRTIFAEAGEPETFEVVVPKPLGIQLQEKEGIGVVVSMVYEGGNAFKAGLAAGDIVVATSASIGPGMWPKKTVSGVEAAIQTRIDRQVRLRMVRPCRDERKLPWEGPLIDTYEVELGQPIGMVLREKPGLQGSGEVEVAEVAAGGSAAQSGLVRAGDAVLATSGTIGDTLWGKSSLEGVLAAISTRLALSPTVTLRMRRSSELGPWARELHAVSRGERTRLSKDARSSLRKQRRELRDGVLRGESVHEALRDLTVQAVARSDDAHLLRRVLHRLRSCGK